MIMCNTLESNRSELLTVRQNRRRFFRMTCSIETEFVLLRKNEFGKLTSAEMQKGTICDISGGGARITSESEMEVKDRLFITLHLDNEDLFLTGEIRTKQKTPNKTKNKRYGVIFCNISEVEQDKIVRYMFWQSRKA